jgi:hypothetical protein
MIKFILALMFQGIFPCFLGLGGGQYTGQAQNAYTAANTAAGGYGSAAAGQGAALNPFFTQEMQAQHSLTPGQQNEMLTAAGQGAGGAFGAAEGQIDRNAARTGNATGVTKSLDEMARDRAKSAAGTAEGVAAQDVMGAQQLRQEGAAGEQGLYGTNVNAQLGAMKQVDTDINTENAVKGQNWLSQLNQIAQFGGNVAKDITGGAGAASAVQNL